MSRAPGKVIRTGGFVKNGFVTCSIMKTPLYLLLSFIAGLCVTARVQAQTSTFNSMTVKITGAKQGWIKGGIVQKGREGLIHGISLDQTMSRALNAQDRATNREQSMLEMGVLKFNKPLDKSSPLLQRALSDGELLSRVEFTFYGRRDLAQTGPAGAESVLYTVILTDARIVGIQDVFTPASTANPMNFQEIVSLSYNKIEWTWVDGVITHQVSRPTP